MVAPDSLIDSPMDRPAAKGDMSPCDPELLAAPDEKSLLHFSSVAPGDSRTWVLHVIDESPPLTNGNENICESQETEVYKQPSYVALACCISGYSTLSYDSKQRQNLRSVSPIRVHGYTQNATYSSDCGSYLTTVPREMNAKMQTQGKGIDILNGCGGLHSPRHVSNIKVTHESRSYKSLESYSTYNSTSTRFSCSPVGSPLNSNDNGDKNGTSRLLTPTKITEQLSPSSFIVQRVERLYGPGALAQGFYTRKGGNQTVHKEAKKPSGIEQINDSLPVLKLLRPEFRAQLTVANRKHRTPTPEQLESEFEPKSMANLKISTGETEVDTTDASPISPVAFSSGVRDGHFFLKIHSQHVAMLEKLAAEAEKELETCENEEAAGILRAAAGKARLLVAQKLNQFKGLCMKNIEQSETDVFPTTNEDLEGFWDMVLIQIEDVKNQFEKISILKANNWKLPTSPKADVPKATKKQTIPRKVKEPSEASRARDEARRKLIEQRRKALKESQSETSDLIIV